jgi:hypothetical protein
MSYWAQCKGGRALIAKGATATAAYVDVSAGVNTKGTWQELTAAALPHPVDWLTVRQGGGPAALYMTDIGVSPASGTPITAIISNLPFRTSNDYAASGRAWDFPVSVPAGSRLWARCSATSSSRAIRTALFCRCRSLGEPAYSWDRVRDYGASATTCYGTQIDPGGVANTKGVWAQLAAATTAPIRRMTLSLQDNGVVPWGTWKYDIAIGPAGSEVVIAPDIPMHGADIGRAIVSPTEWITANLPTGVRLAVRAACTDTGGNRYTYATLHALG